MAGGVALIASSSQRVGCGRAGAAVENVAPQQRQGPAESPAVGAPHRGHVTGVPAGSAATSRWKLQYSLGLGPGEPRKTSITTRLPFANLSSFGQLMGNMPVAS